MAAKKTNILEKHPEVDNNAQDYFFYEKEPVIEEVVNRGDSREKEPKAYDITDKDMDGLAKFALSCLDKNLLEDNRVAAIDSAISLAIGSMDEGRWQGKVSGTTSGLIAELVDKKLTSKEEGKVMDKEGQNAQYSNSVGQGSEETAKKASEEVEAAAAAKAAPPKKGVVVKLKGGRPQEQTTGQTNKAISKMPSKDRAGMKKLIQKGNTVILSSLTERLDKVASAVQIAGMEGLATQLDTVANTLEKEAGPMEGQQEVATDMQEQLPWLVEALQGFREQGPAWNPNELATKIQKDFLKNPQYAGAFKNLWKISDHDRALRLVSSILDTNNYYNELMGLIESYKDAPLSNHN